MSDLAEQVIVIDSVTRLEGARGRIVVSGSHAGRYAASLVADAGVRAVILNDAGRGLDDAGVEGLALLNDVGIPAAAVDHRSARIGTAADSMAHGRISVVNDAARLLGCQVGHDVITCLDALRHAQAPGARLSLTTEGRYRLLGDVLPPVWALDSVALTDASDDGAILVTGSHGNLLGGRPETAVKSRPFAAFYNDAGGTTDGLLPTRLPVLEARGIAGVTVAAASARIGDGRSTYETGIVSSLNERARAIGGEEGIAARELVARFIGAAQAGGTP
jgi:hypothetical protein